MTEEELLQIKESIEKYLLANDYENAFCSFLIHIGRLNYQDRDSFIIYFKNYFRNKIFFKKNNLKK